MPGIGRPLGPLFLVLSLAACGNADTGTPLTLGFDSRDLDESIAPADDFFAHVNQRWLDATPIPPEWSSYGVMQQLHEQTEQQVLEIIEDSLANTAREQGSNAQKIGDLYASFMDEAAVEAAGLDPLDAELARIDALADHDELIRYFGHALLIGLQVPVNFYIDADATDPDRSLAYFWQDGLGLPDRDFYLADNRQLARIRAAYAAHVENMYKLAEWPSGPQAAELILGIERRLAELHWSRVQNRNREKIYSNQYDLPAAEELSPQLNWSSLLESGEFGAPDRFVIAQTDYFTALGELIRNIPMADWREYLRFKLLKAYARYLGPAIADEDFDFQRRVLRGQEEERPRWKRGVRLVNAALGEMVGEAYVERHFPPAAKARMRELVDNLKIAFAESIQELDWMTPDTRAAALEKLEKFTTKIGYPEKWRDYSSLEIAADDLIGNVRRTREFEHRREVAKLGEPVDRTEWGMTPQTVNAYYRPTANEIVFPAAILQPPFFDLGADDAVNYGAIGAVIGHEISHGFDDQGRKFDGDGRLRDWWTAEDAAEYERRAQVLVEQYSAFQPLPDVRINGELTLGENIADLAGLVVAYRAYQVSLNGQPAPEIDGFSGDERFFIGYAQAWRTQYRDELLRERLVRGPHSPARYRVNGVLRNMPEFFEVFGVEDGAGMYLAPDQRVRIW
ncbi:MAG: M13 family metallopeptidase [Gammaproteobacteria bacterium]|nr:M13 family metallopeptidase [Gammaproteobacteria bacterium]